MRVRAAVGGGGEGEGQGRGRGVGCAWRSTKAERAHAYTGPAALTTCAKETEPYVVPRVPAWR